MGYIKDELIIESRYKVLKKIAKVRIATTYKVKDTRTRNEYIVKLFDGLSIDDIYEQFTPEMMEKTVSINFMNITDFLDFGVHKGKMFFVREAFSESALGNISFSSITLEQFYSILSQMLSAISFLDSQNFNATNLKMSNFLYKMNKKKIYLKLTDYFYLGTSRKDDLYNPDYLYIAPETISNNTINLVSNFYSLGVILYKMVAGVFPYTVEDINSYIKDRTLKLVMPLSQKDKRISENLSEFILKMIKLNPDDRFQSMEELVDGLNNIQSVDYSFLIKPDLKNYINYHDYYVDEDISHALVNHIEYIQKKDVENIIVLHGQKGIRKDRTISLFRYHILNENYLIFDYHCSKENKDPFYSLCVEFIDANLIDKKEWERAEPEISERFRAFVKKSNKEITSKIEDENTVKDFTLVAKFLMFVSKKDRPLIFVIRNAELLESITLKFLNFLTDYKTDSGTFSTSSILIVLSTNNINKYYNLKQPFVKFIHSKTMKYTQTGNYISRLLKNQKAPENLISKIWYYAHGNPWYVKLLVLYLVRNKFIYEENNKIIFKKVIDIEVPKEINNNLIYRLANLNLTLKYNLEKLVWLAVKFTKNLFVELIDENYEENIRKLQDNDFIEQVNDNLYKVIPDYLYKFLRNSLLNNVQEEISTKYLGYLLKNPNIKPPFNFILRHCEIVKEYDIVKKILLLYAEEFISEYNINEYVATIFEIYKRVPKNKKKEKKEVGLLLVLNYEYIFKFDLLEKIKSYFDKSQDNSCKYLINAHYYIKMDNYEKSAEHLSRAYKLAETDEEKYVTEMIGAFVLNRMGKNYVKIKDKLGYELIDNLPSEKLLSNFESKFKKYYQLKFQKLKILKYFDMNNDFKAAELTHKILSNLKYVNNHLEKLLLMDFYNFLGITYSNDKRNREAIAEYEKALDIAEKYNILYYIMLLKNNIADTYLVMGKPNTALSYLRSMTKICTKSLCFNLKIQLLVNIAEALIKIGNFEEALAALDNAINISQSLDNKPFFNGILHNYSLIKIKIINFNYYLKHIKKYFPDLLKGEIVQLNPTVKTYFYFLNQIGNYNEIKNLLDKNKEVLNSNEEFYYRAKSFVLFNELKNNLNSIELKEKTLDILEKVKERSYNINSKYAEAITLINMSEAYLLLGDLEEAQKTNDQAQKICRENEYNYWLYQAKLIKVLIDLQYPEKSIYQIFFDLLDINSYFVTNNIFYGNIVALYIAINILNFMDRKKIAKRYFNKLYLKSLENVIAGLNEDYKNYFYKKFPKKYSYLVKTSRVKIAKRNIKDLSKLLYEFSFLLNNDDKYSREIKLKSFLKDYTGFQKYAIYKKDENNNFNIIFSNLESLTETTVTNLKRYLTKALNEFSILFYDDDKYHITIIPLKSGGKAYGVMLIYEDKDYFILNENDKERLLFLSAQLAFYFMYYDNYFKVNKTREKVKEILSSFKEIISNNDIGQLEQNLLEKLCKILNAKRAFLFKAEKEILYHIEIDDLPENEIHKNIDLSKIEQINKEKGNVHKYETIENYKGKKSIFLLKLDFEKVGYSGTYYFDNYKNNKNLEKLDDEFIEILIDMVRTAIGIVKRNIISEQLRREIQNFEKEKLLFINLLNHELNTPLTLINYAKDSLKKIIGTKCLLDNKKINKDFSNIEKNIERLKYLLNMLNKYYDYKNNYQPYYEKINLKDLLNDITREFEKETKEAERILTFEMQIDNDLPQELLLDKKAIEDLLRILISNSVKYSPNYKKIIIGARYAIYDYELVSDETLVLFVTDFGKGIKPELKDKIFDLIFEGKELTAHKSGGSYDYNAGALGMGLAIAKEIVKNLNGNISYESKPEFKTTFFIRLPIIKREK